MSKRKKRQIKLVREYRGVTIYRSTEPGYRLPWTADGGGGSLAADTLAGIKELIRDNLPKKGKPNGTRIIR